MAEKPSVEETPIVTVPPKPRIRWPLALFFAGITGGLRSLASLTNDAFAFAHTKKIAADAANSFSKLSDLRTARNPTELLNSTSEAELAVTNAYIETLEKQKKLPEYFTKVDKRDRWIGIIGLGAMMGAGIAGWFRGKAEEKKWENEVKSALHLPANTEISVHEAPRKSWTQHTLPFGSHRETVQQKRDFDIEQEI